MAKGVNGSEEMKRAWQLFDEGDKWAARRLAAALVSTEAPPAAAKEARELLARTEPPPLFRILAIGCACLIAGLIALAILRS